jgi:hypothetical protein
VNNGARDLPFLQLNMHEKIRVQNLDLVVHDAEKEINKYDINSVSRITNKQAHFDMWIVALVM